MDWVAPIGAADAIGGASRGEGCKPRPRTLAGPTASPAEPPRFEPCPKGSSQKIRGVYRRHARLRSRIKPLAPLVASSAEDCRLVSRRMAPKRAKGRGWVGDRRGAHRRRERDQASARTIRRWKRAVRREPMAPRDGFLSATTGAARPSYTRPLELQLNSGRDQRRGDTAGPSPPLNPALPRQTARPATRPTPARSPGR